MSVVKVRRNFFYDLGFEHLKKGFCLIWLIVFNEILLLTERDLLKDAGRDRGLIYRRTTCDSSVRERSKIVWCTLSLISVLFFPSRAILL